MKTIEHLYYVPNVQIKDFNVLTDESFFNKLIKNEEETCENLLKWKETIITQQVIYWIMNTFQSITNKLH